MDRSVLSPDALAAALATLPHWEGDTHGIGRTFSFNSYEEGVAFAVRVALHAQRVDHHPELRIGWCRVEVRYVTHDAGGVTARDLENARAVDAMR